LNNKEIWIEEKLEINKGRTLKIKITKSLEKVKSKFQEIEVVDSDAFGKILLINGIIMVTESDEFCYHEMIAHVPLCVHPKAQKVLVIGGGDGGTVREILKHDSVEGIDVCEIDGKVIEICKKHFPDLANSFDDFKVKIFCEDGNKFIKAHKNEYDIIIVDSSDPIGPAEVLFRREFYEAMYLAVLLASWRTYLKARSREIKILSLSLVGIVIAFLVFNFTAGSFYNSQLMAMFWLLAGLVYRASGEYKPIIEDK